MKQCICRYDDWSVFKTENGLVLENEDGSTKAVTEVFRVSADSRPDYGDLSFEKFDALAREAGIEYDYCGELDDFSAYVFWKAAN